MSESLGNVVRDSKGKGKGNDKYCNSPSTMEKVLLSHTQMQMRIILN